MIGAQSQLTHDMMCAAGGAQALALVQDLKQAVDDVTRGSVASALLMEFPPDVETFQKLRPDDFEKAYGEEKPVPNRVDPLVLAKLKSVVPARNTHEKHGAVRFCPSRTSPPTCASGLPKHVRRLAHRTDAPRHDSSEGALGGTGRRTKARGTSRGLGAGRWERRITGCART